MNRPFGVTGAPATGVNGDGPSLQLEPDVVEALIAGARASFRRAFTREDYPDLDFDQDVWLVAKPGQRKRRWSVSLKPDPEHTLPLAPTYAGIVKAYLLDQGLTGNAAGRVARIARNLWSAIEARIGHSPFRWNDLRPADVEAVEARWLGNPGLAPSYRRNNVDTLQKLLKWLTANQVCDAFEWQPSAPRPGKGLRSAPEREKRLDRLPTRAAIEGLGRVYRNHANWLFHNRSAALG